MSIIAIAFGILVVLIIALKMLRVAMSVGVRLIVAAVFICALAAAYWYFRTHIVMP